MGTAANAEPGGSRQQVPPGAATRTVVAVFGVLAALAGIEHGVGEIRQGSVPPPGWVIRSWPEQEAFEVLGGEPALTVIPDLLVSGVATVVVSTALGVWAITGVHRRHGGLVLIGLSLLLLAAGGGFGPPLLGIVLGLGAAWPAVPSQRFGATRRALAPMWPWALGAGVVGYLGLVPGTLVMHAVWRSPSPAGVYGLMVLAFGGVILALPAARARDRLEGGRGVVYAQSDSGHRSRSTR
ncbi:hypothetical protein G6038_01415 [Rhodococcus sp. 14C212]|uniref:hypothetical protein n=1 Tax=Rhodococcus sp. 14C212 TaxID=2711209 RepID=UPI0013EA6B5D|nr:hypothetical protein [Rhodococcus sp. 14C212]NGP04158.1 hypothetical protein [Rhodococcus sp. 14C212]